ncbi:hypothetical protein AAMO2058_001466200, partial [Amorphochlora amoebiformis]
MHTTRIRSKLTPLVKLSLSWDQNATARASVVCRHRQALQSIFFSKLLSCVNKVSFSVSPAVRDRILHGHEHGKILKPMTLFWSRLC